MSTGALKRLQAAMQLSLAVDPAPTRRVDAPAEPLLAHRLAEAFLFASPEPVGEAALALRLPPGTDIRAILADLAGFYAGRGIRLVRAAGGWTFRTAPDLAAALKGPDGAAQKLSRAAIEVLAIIAYHQPATRAEIEDIRGVATSKGTLDTLLEAGWVRLRGRRRAPGRPVTFGTTPAFLSHFGLDSVGDLPGLEELKGLGFLEGRIPPDLAMPLPDDSSALAPDEDPLEPDLLSVTPLGDEDC